MTVADRIKQKRIELGLSQDELAEKMGYASKSAVSRAENSGDDIGLKRVKAFAEALNCSESELMGWYDTAELDKELFNKSALELYYKYISADAKTRNIVDQLLERGD